MAPRTRFRERAVEHHRNTDGLGAVFGHEPEEPAAPETRRRFRLLRRAGPRVPVCLQTQISDCGPACVVMTLRLHGIEVTLDEIRSRVDPGRSGSSARALLDLLRGHGLTARGVRTDLAGLARLSPGAILFWNFNHFVVLERMSDGWADIVDPAFGRRRITAATLSESFTGVALEVEAPLHGTRAAKASGDTPAPWSRLRAVLPPRGELTGLLGLSTLLMSLELALPLGAASLVQTVLPAGDGVTLAGAAIAAVGVTVLFVVLQLTRALLMARRQAIADKKLTWGTAAHLVALPYPWFVTRQAGDLAMRVRTSSTLNQVLSLTTIGSALDSVLIVAYLLALIVIDPALAAVVVTLIAVQVGVLGLTWRQQTALSQEVLERQTRTQDELMELLTSIGTLKAAGVEGLAAERWSHTLAREVNKRLHARRRLSVMTSLSRGVQFSAPLLVLLAGGARVLAGDTGLGGALAFATLTIALFVPLGRVFDGATQLAAVRPALVKLDDVLRTGPEPRGLLAGTGVAEPGRIAAEDLSFRYPGATADALTGVDLAVEPGQFVAVIGRSGSGKSTLGLLLAGLQPPTGGRITVDGHDLATLDGPTYRRQIGYVNQDAQLFSGTIRENIGFGVDGFGHPDLVRHAELARVHQEILALPMGYDTIVGPHGHGLSGGQRQRVVLARTLAREPRLIIFDEATSALDPALEREIFQGLLRAGITVVVIAHRLTVLDDADRVVVMRGGRVVEAGDPASLHADGTEFACLT
ncbi:peptidase domain-containing ABC transporter [Actinoplanes sp. NBRC 101535]|uniref:peptidase domain-containing ABC transporter n=1 Tax=Actinoplanes sp. NBRC 101535 TaxID=3032196 RepID=UPI002552FD32|nr:peptidase domain-containing ABC transporter [Actinoplanes sp. NBRC 101535]